MGKNYFSEEQIKALEKNPYVERTSEKAITYSEEFKKKYYEELQNGKSPSTIFRECGFDTKVLGRERVKNFTKRIKKQAGRVEQFQDMRSENTGRPRIKERSMEEELEYLKHKIEFQNQQIEALKKINFVNRKATWKSQKKNSK